MTPEEQAVLKFEIEIGWFEEYLVTMELFLDGQQEDHAANIQELREQLNDQKITPEQFDAWSDDDKFHLESLDWYRNLLRRSDSLTDFMKRLR